jgi:DUF4097 and DUF4098 domain-containing protein YvlB
MRIVSEAGSTSIETVAPPKKKWALRDRSGTIDYIVIVPQTLKAVELELVDGEISINGLREGSARARVVNGRLSARNCFGDLSFQASNGSIDFYYDWWEERERTVEATVPNGMLGVFVPRSASFYLQAETRGGNVIGNLIDGDEAEHGHRKQVAMKIGSANGARFQLKSGNGNIHVHGY